MARNSDIRAFLPTIFPRATPADIKAILFNIVNQSNREQFGVVTINNDLYTIQAVEGDKIMIGNDPATYMIGDIRKAMAEYRALSSSIRKDDLFFLSVLFKEPRRYPKLIKQLGGIDRCCLLNGELLAAIIKRIHNWDRVGSDNVITLTHSPDDGITNFIISVPSIKFVNEVPVAEIVITQNDEVLFQETRRFNIPTKVKVGNSGFSERLKKYNVEVALTNHLLNPLAQKLGRDRAAYVIAQLISLLTAHRGKGRSPTITLELDEKRRRLRCEHHVAEGIDRLAIWVDNVSVTTGFDISPVQLTTGFNILRQIEAFDYTPALVLLTKDVFDLKIFRESNRNIFRQLKSALNQLQGGGRSIKTPNIFVNGLTLTPRHWVDGKTYYGIDYLVNGEIYCYERLFGLELVNPKSKNGQTGNFVQRLVKKIFK